MTAHRAQGGTWDLAIAVGADGLYREAAYVQLSRGRHANWLVIPDTQMAEIDAELARHDHGLPLPDEQPPAGSTTSSTGSNGPGPSSWPSPGTPTPTASPGSPPATMSPNSKTGRRHCRSVERTAAQLVGAEPDQVARTLDTRPAHRPPRRGSGSRSRPSTATTSAPSSPSTTPPARSPSSSPPTTAPPPAGTCPGPRSRSSTGTSHPSGSSHPPPKARLDRLVADGERQLDRITAILAASGVEPGEARRCERAIEVGHRPGRRTARPRNHPTGSSTSSANGPPHPTGRPRGTTASAAWPATASTRTSPTRPRHGTRAFPGPSGDASLASRGPTDDRDPDRPDGSLAAGTELLSPHRSADELLARRHQLEAILAAAPADQRDLLNRLQDRDQVTLIDTRQALTEALATQGATPGVDPRTLAPHHRARRDHRRARGPAHSRSAART